MKLVAWNIVTWHGTKRHPPKRRLRFDCALGGLSSLQSSDMVLYCRAELFQRDGASRILLQDGSGARIGLQTFHAEGCQSAAYSRTTIRSLDCGSEQLSHLR